MGDFFRKPKHFRRIAMCFEKTDVSDAAMIDAVSSRLVFAYMFTGSSHKTQPKDSTAVARYLVERPSIACIYHIRMISS